MYPRLSDYVAKQRDSLVTPTFKCYHPSRVYNQFIDEYVWVDCGHCESCLNRKSSMLSQRVQDECKQHKWSLFFTLTYDNAHLPVLSYDFDNDKFSLDRPISSTNFEKLSFSSAEVRSYLDLDNLDVYDLQPCKSDFNGIAVVCRSDVQRFLKRLRINLHRNLIFSCYKDDKPIFTHSDSLAQLSDFQKSLRYFISSEYGPKTFRPHYHGIIWTDSDAVADYLQCSISACWSMCSSDRVDVSVVQSSAPNYVAGYVNSVINLPKILQLKFTRPFVLASKNPIIGSYKSDVEAAADVLFNGVVESLVEKKQEDESVFSYVPFGRSFFNRYFSAPKSYRSEVDYDYISLYEKYQSGRFLRQYTKKNGRRVLDSFASCPCDHKSMIYINSLAYCYQDFRFSRCMDFWISRPHRFPLRDDSGRLTGEYVFKQLTASEYLQLFDKLYYNVAMNVLRKFYLSQEYVSYKLHTPFAFHRDLDLFYLHHYPEFVYNIPRQMDIDDYNFRLRGRSFSLFNQLDMNFGSVYKYKCNNANIYCQLRDDIASPPVDAVTRAYRVKVHDSFIKSTVKKHYNEKFTDLHFNH